MIFLGKTDDGTKVFASVVNLNAFINAPSDSDVFVVTLDDDGNESHTSFKRSEIEWIGVDTD